jgi:hypothetical protein
MENLIIGLLVGLASAGILLAMWRMADRLREEIKAEESSASRPADSSEPRAK